MHDVPRGDGAVGGREKILEASGSSLVFLQFAYPAHQISVLLSTAAHTEATTLCCVLWDVFRDTHPGISAKRC
jgi:hypothetical protein